jgi:hypothetical protein
MEICQFPKSLLTEALEARDNNEHSKTKDLNTKEPEAKDEIKQFEPQIPAETANGNEPDNVKGCKPPDYDPNCLDTIR